METLGTLADKLTTIQLKLWHTDDPERTNSLQSQQLQLQEEMDELVRKAITGEIPPERLTFAANKVYKKDGNEMREIVGTLGELFSKLAEVNCRLWHVQENVYDFEKVPLDQKDEVIKQLAIVNLERNECIDRVDREFQRLCQFSSR